MYLTLVGLDKGVKGPHTVLPKGVHKYPFSFRLPNSPSLPPSVHGSIPLGGIKYYLKANADVPWAVDPTVEVSFPFASFNQLRDPALAQPMEDEVALSEWCCFGDGGAAAVRAHILQPVTCVSEFGQTLPIVVHLLGTAATDKKIHGVRVRVITRIKLRAGGGSTYMDDVLHTADFGVQDGAVLAAPKHEMMPQGQQLVPVTLLCPFRVPTADSHCATSTTFVEVTLRVEGGWQTPQVHLPLHVLPFDPALLSDMGQRGGGSTGSSDGSVDGLSPSEPEDPAMPAFVGQPQMLALQAALAKHGYMGQ